MASRWSRRRVLSANRACQMSALVMVIDALVRALTPDLDIYRAANLLVKKHGIDAHIQAAMKTDAMLDAGDLDGLATWKRILRASLISHEKDMNKAMHSTPPDVQGLPRLAMTVGDRCGGWRGGGGPGSLRPTHRNYCRAACGSLDRASRGVIKAPRLRIVAGGAAECVRSFIPGPCFL